VAFITHIVFCDETKTVVKPLIGHMSQILGEYDLFDDRVVVWRQGLTLSEQARVLTHELQHAKDRRLLLITYLFFVLGTGLGAFLLASIVCIVLPILLGPYMTLPIFSGLHYSAALIAPVHTGLIMETFLFVACCELHRWTETRAKNAATSALRPLFRAD